MKYQNKRNGTIAELLETNEKNKTVILQIEGGKSTACTISTLKRWWMPIEDNEVIENPADSADVEKTSEEEVAEDMGQESNAEETIPTAADNEVRETSIDDDVKGKSKKRTVKKQDNPEVANILKYIQEKMDTAGAEVFTPEKAPNVRALKIGNHMFARLNVSRSGVGLCCRSKAVSSSTPDKVQKHIFDYIFVFTDLSKTDLIDSLLQESLEYQITKNNSKEEK